MQNSLANRQLSFTSSYNNRVKWYHLALMQLEQNVIDD